MSRVPSRRVMPPGAYQPFAPARRPGGRPTDKPRYRVLVHRQYKDLWDALPQRVGLDSAQEFYDHVAGAPGEAPAINRTTILAGRAGRPIQEGFSRTIHYGLVKQLLPVFGGRLIAALPDGDGKLFPGDSYEISGAGRINYQYNPAYVDGARGDPHPVVFILTINLSSH